MLREHIQTHVSIVLIRRVPGTLKHHVVSMCRMDTLICATVSWTRGVFTMGGVRLHVTTRIPDDLLIP